MTFNIFGNSQRATESSSNISSRNCQHFFYIEVCDIWGCAESDLICHLLPNSSVVRKNGSDYGKVLEVSLNNRLVVVQWDGEKKPTEYDSVGAPGWEEEFQLHQEANGRPTPTP